MPAKDSKSKDRKRNKPKPPVWPGDEQPTAASTSSAETTSSQAKSLARLKEAGPYKCGICGKEYELPTSLGIHMKHEHGVAGKTHPAKRHYTKRGSNGNHSDQPVEHAAEADIEFAVGVAFGHTQAWLEAYGNAVGIPPTILALRLAELLRRSSSRPGMGTQYRLPNLRS